MARDLGPTLHKLDSATRLKLNEDEKRELGTVVYLASGYDNRVNVYRPEDWKRLKETFDRLPPYNPVANDLRSLLVEAGSQCEVDPQGRIRIPDDQDDWAGLDDAHQMVFLTRARDHWDIWERSRYQAYLRSVNELKARSEDYFGPQCVAQTEEDDS